jgi:hypothetical protein
MSKLDYRNIEKDPARCGGQPVVAGTRIRVAVILACYRQGLSIEEIVQQYPCSSTRNCVPRMYMTLWRVPTITYTKLTPI